MPDKPKKPTKKPGKSKRKPAPENQSKAVRQYNALFDSLSTREQVEQVELLFKWYFGPHSIVLIVLVVVGIGWLMTLA